MAMEVEVGAPVGIEVGTVRVREPVSVDAPTTTVPVTVARPSAMQSETKTDEFEVPSAAKFLKLPLCAKGGGRERDRRTHDCSR